VQNDDVAADPAAGASNHITAPIPTPNAAETATGPTQANEAPTDSSVAKKEEHKQIGNFTVGK